MGTGTPGTGVQGHPVQGYRYRDTQYRANSLNTGQIASILGQIASIPGQIASILGQIASIQANSLDTGLISVPNSGFMSQPVDFVSQPVLLTIRKVRFRGFEGFQHSAWSIMEFGMVNPEAGPDTGTVGCTKAVF